MINPDQQEKHLAPLDTRVKQRLTRATIVLALIIVTGFLVIAEMAARLIERISGR